MPRPGTSIRNKGLGLDLHGVRLVYNKVVQEDQLRHHAAVTHDGLEGYSSESVVDKTLFKFRTVQPQEFSLSESEEQPLKTLWEQLPSWLTPMCHENVGDRNLQERIINVVTSIPFIVLGLRIPRKRLASKLYGASLCGVGVASTLYHLSSGEVRKFFRHGDYSMIAASTLCLSGAIRQENSTATMIASAISLPFSPFVVSVFHISLMEATFAQRAKTEPAVRKAYDIHRLSSALGAALFIADANIPYVHAAWHLAAAVGVATSAALVL